MFDAAKTYLFLANLCELLLMNRKCFYQKLFTFSTVNFKNKSFWVGGLVAFRRKTAYNAPSKHFHFKNQKKMYFKNVSYEMGTKSQ